MSCVIFFLSFLCSVNRLYAPHPAVEIRTILGRSNCDGYRHSDNSGVHFSRQHRQRFCEWTFFCFQESSLNRLSLLYVMRRHIQLSLFLGWRHLHPRWFSDYPRQLFCQQQGTLQLCECCVFMNFFYLLLCEPVPAPFPISCGGNSNCFREEQLQLKMAL